MLVSAIDAGVVRKLRAQAKWVREKAAETDINQFKWMMDGLANELEHMAEDLEHTRN